MKTLLRALRTLALMVLGATAAGALAFGAWHLTGENDAVLLIALFLATIPCALATALLDNRLARGAWLTWKDGTRAW